MSDLSQQRALPAASERNTPRRAVLAVSYAATLLPPLGAIAGLYLVIRWRTLQGLVVIAISVAVFFAYRAAFDDEETSGRSGPYVECVTQRAKRLKGSEPFQKASRACEELLP
jgi:hypothetical protein